MVRKTIKKNVKSYSLEFTGNTSIHGLKFLTEVDRHPLERIWWLIVVITSLCWCIYLIGEAYRKWHSSPIIIALSNSPTSISEIVFPAVTICPEARADQKLYQYTLGYSKISSEQRFIRKLRPLADYGLTKEEVEYVVYMDIVCGLRLPNVSYHLVYAEKFVDYFFNVTPRFVANVSWQGETVKQEEFLIPVLTEKGVCYTFNSVDREDIFRDAIVNYVPPYLNLTRFNRSEKYDDMDDVEHRYLRRTTVSGTAGGFELVLHTRDWEADQNCNRGRQGFSVSVHHPLEIPQFRERPLLLDLDEEVTAIVKPTMTQTPEQLQKYEPQVRRCFFASEKSLRYFRTYNQRNCLLECTTNITIRECGCVSYSMPRDMFTPICVGDNRFCPKKAKYALNKEMGGNSLFPHRTYGQMCDCLPLCSTLDFDVEESRRAYNWRAQIFGPMKMDPQLRDNDRFHLSRLRVHFKDMQLVATERRELYSKMDFMASCGGLMGLFMGFSLISLFEILYFLSLRLLCNVRNRQEKGKWPRAHSLRNVKIGSFKKANGLL